MFADDVQLYLALEEVDLPLMYQLINDDLSRIIRWADENLLQINASKTKVMFISRTLITTPCHRFV